MTREQKLALIMGFALVLVVGVLVSDHLSKASRGDALQTGGLEGALAQRTDREVNPLLVNRGAVGDAFATPEVPAEERGFFDRMRDGFEEAAGDVGTLPKAARTTETRERSEVPEFVNGQSPMTADRPAGAKIYRVKPDDSLWSIAQREYNDGALHTKLAEYNHDRVGQGGTIREGASLLIPAKDVLLRYQRGDNRVVGRENARPTPQREAPTPRTRTVEYTVKKGETLSGICQRELGSGKRWREVVELNKGDIPEDGIVRIGQTILLPQG